MQLSVHSFLRMLARSELLSVEQMQTVEQEFAKSPRDAPSEAICAWLRQRDMVTDWQAQKLLQAKFRGFFLGPYKLLSKVARGGMSTIYSAMHRESGEIHALKVLPLARTSKASYLPRFQREAEITQRLKHPHIIRVFGVHSESDGLDAVHFMAMEVLRGRDLADIVNSDGPLPCRKAAEFIRQAATGLEYAHQAGLVHRDIKPSNLFLSDDQTVRILDLGLAQDFDSEENLTREFNERVLGTADYLAPEQAVDSHTVDGRADIYSLGCALYFLLTGRPPFTEGTLVQRLIAHRTKAPTPISEVRDDVPEELTEILSTMITKNRDDRIASAGDVADRLSQFLAHTAGQQYLDEKPEGLLTLSSAPRPRQPSSTASGPLSPEVMEILAAETLTSASDDSTPHPHPPCDDEEAIYAIVPQSDFLPGFTELLRHIEMNCEGSLSHDSRSAELLTLTRSLLDRPRELELATMVAFNRLLHDPDLVVHSTSTTRVNWWMLALSLVLLLIVIVAAVLNWHDVI